MTAQEITNQLQAIASEDDFAWRSAELADRWSSEGLGLEAVEPVLRFMEGHPGIDFGTPGYLVHFVERFHRNGYEEKLIESVQRKPTPHTVWMLNRLINGTEAVDERKRLISLMETARRNPFVDKPTIQRLDDYLARLLG